MTKRASIKRQGSINRNVFQSKRISVGNERYSSGTGFIIIPNNMSRDSYIKRVYQTGVCIIISDTGEVIKDARVPKRMLPEIEFPLEDTDRGSLISWVNVPIKNQIILTGVLLAPNEMYSYQEFEKVIEFRDRQTDNSHTNITDLRNGYNLSETYYSQDEVPFDSANEVKAKSPSKQSSMTVYCDGRAFLYGDDLARVFSEEEIQIQTGTQDGEISTLTINRDGNFNYRDRFGNSVEINGQNGQINISSNTVVNINSERINFGEGTEPILKGDISVEQLEVDRNKLDAVVDALTGSAVTSGDGGLAYRSNIELALQNVASADYSEVKSERTYTD